MKLDQKIHHDYTEALKRREVDRVAALRLILSALKNEAIKLGKVGYTLSEDETMAVLARERKQRIEAADQYAAAGRDELANKERTERKIIESYLPPELSEDELRQIVDETVRRLDASTKADMGRVMAALKEKITSPADISKAAQIAAKILLS